MAGTIQLQTYKSRVRNKLDDQSYSDGVLTDFANDTNRDICNKAPWPFMEKSFSGTLTKDDYKFNTASSMPDLQQFINMELISPTASVVYLDYMTYQEFDQRYPNPGSLSNQIPLAWTQFGPDMIFGPAGVDQTYTIQTKYIKVPATVANAADVLDVPDDFSELVVLGMYARALEQVDQPDYAVAQWNRYKELLNDMKMRYAVRQIGTPLRVQTQRTMPAANRWITW